MTRKDNFMKFIDNAIANQKGIEIEINDPKQPYFQSRGFSSQGVVNAKIEFQKLYDDDLKLINDKSIQIKEYKYI